MLLDLQARSSLKLVFSLRSSALTPKILTAFSINTWIASSSGGSVGLGFAIPINNLKSAIDSFITKGKIVYGWVGISLLDIPVEYKDDLGVNGIEGAFAAEVFANSPAFKGGIKPGDYITEVNGKKVKSTNQLVRDIGNLEAGTSATFSVIRGGKKISDIISSNTAKNVEPDEFRTELHDYLYGDGKETLEKIQIRQQLDYISNTQKDIKDVEKQQRQVTKGLEAFIKELDRWANEINKKGATYKSVMNDGDPFASSKTGSLKAGDADMDSKDQDAATKSIDKEIASMKELSNAVTIAFGMIVQAVKDRNRQAKAICVKAIGYKHEAAGYYNYSESSVDDLFAGVTIR